MFAYIRGGADARPLMTTPQDQPDRARRLHAKRLEDASRFHDNRASSGVVRGPCSARPQVQVRADHHHFILLNSSWNLRRYVKCAGRVFMETRLHFDSQAHWDVSMK